MWNLVFLKRPVGPHYFTVLHVDSHLSLAFLSECWSTTFKLPLKRMLKLLNMLLSALEGKQIFFFFIPAQDMYIKKRNYIYLVHITNIPLWFDEPWTFQWETFAVNITCSILGHNWSLSSCLWTKGFSHRAREQRVSMVSWDTLTILDVVGKLV